MRSSRGSAIVLVVEDDAALRALYRTALIGAGYTVFAVEDGFDALHLIESETPDILVLDIALPRLGGRDVQRELRSRAETCHIPIIVVTGTDLRDFNESEVDRLFQKPVSTETLIDTVDLFTRETKRRQRAQLI